MNATPPLARRLRAREGLAQFSLTVVVVATLARLLLHGQAWLAVAATGLLLYGVSIWPNVSRQARLFAGLAVPSAALVGLLADTPSQVLTSGLSQAVQFATLLAALATLRLPLRRSTLIAQVAARLVATPPRRRYATVLYGSHWLSLMFSFGTVSMMGEMLRRRGLEAGSNNTARAMMVAVIRGLAMTTTWSPMAIGFAIVSSALPGLEVMAFVSMGLLLATLVLGMDVWHHAPATQGPSAEIPSHEAASDAPLWILVGCSVLLFMATWGLHRLSGWPFMTAASLTLPTCSMLWLLAERVPPVPRGDRRQPSWQTFFSVLTETRSEVLIFSASIFIGQATLASVQALGGETWWSALPVWLLPLLCLWSVPAIAALSVAPTILVLVWAQLFAQMPAALAMPLVHAMALTLGWSLAICVSPVSATLLVASSITGLTAGDIARRWNAGFVVRSGALASALLLLLYRLGW